MPVCHEKGTHGHKGSLSYVRRQIVVEPLGIGRPGRGRNLQNQRFNRMELVGGGGTPVGRDEAGKLSWKDGGFHDAIVKNHLRQQSTRGRAEGKVDDDCQDDHADNAG